MRADAGDDAVGGQVVGGAARWRAGVLDERALVEQQVEPVAHEQLVLAGELLALRREVAFESAGGSALEVVHQRESITTGAAPGA